MPKHAYPEENLHQVSVIVDGRNANHAITRKTVSTRNLDPAGPSLTSILGVLHEVVLVISRVLGRVVTLQSAVLGDTEEGFPQSVDATGNMLLDGGKVLEVLAAIIGVGDGNAEVGVVQVGSGAVVVAVGVQDSAAGQLERERVVHIVLGDWAAEDFANVLPRLRAVGRLDNSHYLRVAFGCAIASDQAAVVHEADAEIVTVRIDDDGLAGFDDAAGQALVQGDRAAGSEADESQSGNKCLGEVKHYD